MRHLTSRRTAGSGQSAIRDGCRSEEIAAVFGRAAEAYDSIVPFFARFGAELVELVDLRPGERVLDVGCGRGATLLPAAEKVGREGLVVGVDLAHNMVTQLRADIRRFGVSNAVVRRMDAEALEGTEESFDVVISGFTLHLVGDPQRMAAELLRALRPHGRCAISAPLMEGREWDFLGGLIGLFAPKACQPVALPFRADFDLPSLLAAVGFSIVRSVDVEMLFMLRDEDQWWDWAWSHGLRAFLEVLAGDTLEEFRRAVYEELGKLRTRKGLPLCHRARFVLAERH